MSRCDRKAALSFCKYVEICRELVFQESFNVLDCGIYRVISRRGSQSDEETGSLINPSVSEEERLKEFSFVQEEDQADHGKRPSGTNKWMLSM